MTDAPPYELIDLAAGRRLERFGARLIDRPAPAAGDERPRRPERWREADARYEPDAGGEGRWLSATRTPWTIEIAGLELVLELRLADGGQVGLFPEHLGLARWLCDRLPGGSADAGEPLHILNLFAYTGAATIALASTGTRVTHVDASRAAVGWAQRNAALAGLADRPVRWIVDDAERFVAREARRGRHYDGIVLDPPSFGRDPRGRSWRLEDRLESLLAACATVLAPEPRTVVLSAHTPGFGPGRLVAAIEAAFGLRAEGVELGVESSAGRRLPLGAAARWSS